MREVEKKRNDIHRWEIGKEYWDGRLKLNINIHNNYRPKWATEKAEVVGLDRINPPLRAVKKKSNVNNHKENQPSGKWILKWIKAAHFVMMVHQP